MSRRGRLGRTVPPRKIGARQQRKLEEDAGGREEGSSLSADLAANEEALRSALGDSFDITFRTMLPDPDGPAVLIVYLRGTVDERLVAGDILRPLAAPGFPAGAAGDVIISSLRERFISVGTVNAVRSTQDAIKAVLGAHVLVLVDGSAVGLDVTTSSWPTRGIIEPESEAGVRGPRDGFSGVILDNVALMRKMIRHPKLRLERRHLGGMTNTVVVVAYIAGMAPESLIDEVNGRLSRVAVDSILESGYVEELIQDHRWSPFPMILRTERPDRVAASLLEGRVAILVDGSPFALVVPAVISMFLTVPDDWYEGYLPGTFLRFLRYAGFVISLVLPAVYVAITTFHQEMIPTRLVISIARQRQGIPFPVLAEALFLQLTFELLREAGIRLPKVIGQAVTIVGALIIGQQVVEAGLVSSFMLIIIAATAIASFSTPVYSMSLTLRLLNPMFIIAGGSMGLFGIVCGMLALLIHVSSLNSFGVPYLTPFSPTRAEGLKDTVVRWPLWAPKRRPVLDPGAAPAPGERPVGSTRRPKQPPRRQRPALVGRGGRSAGQPDRQTQADDWGDST